MKNFFEHIAGKKRKSSKPQFISTQKAQNRVSQRVKRNVVKSTSSLTRLARRRRERKRKTEMAPVRRTLVATWREEGSSVVAKMVDGSSTGPLSSRKVASASSENWGKQKQW